MYRMTYVYSYPQNDKEDDKPRMINQDLHITCAELSAVQKFRRTLVRFSKHPLFSQALLNYFFLLSGKA